MMMNATPMVLGALAALALTVSERSPAGSDWNQWRGPRRDGVSTDTGLLKEWPKDGPPLLWETTGAGRGYSSLAITGGKLFTMGDDGTSGEETFVVCFDDPGGKLHWKTKIGPAYNAHKKQESWNSPRSTPTIDGELLFALAPTGELVCLETATGKERWQKSMQKDFGGRKGDSWGYSESPLVDGDRVVCTPGNEKSTMVCLNKKSGETIWSASSPKNKGAGHASIVISEIGKVRVYVTTTASGGLGVRASDGKVLWT